MDYIPNEEWLAHVYSHQKIHSSFGIFVPSTVIPLARAKSSDDSSLFCLLSFIGLVVLIWYLNKKPNSSQPPQATQPGFDVKGVPSGIAKGKKSGSSGFKIGDVTSPNKCPRCGTEGKVLRTPTTWRCSECGERWT